MPKLLRDAGLPTEQLYELPAGVTTIGRSHTHGIPILHESLSRNHARIEVTPRGTTLHDTHSTNGTFVNGLRVERCHLKAGDRIQCGDFVFEFLPSEAEPTLPEPTLPEPASIHPVPARFSHSDLLELVRSDPGVTSGAIRLNSVRDADRTRDKLQILVRMGQLLSGPQSVDTLLNTVADLVFEVFDIDRVAVLVVDGKTGQLEPRVTKKSPAAREGRAYSRHIVAYVREHGVAALFADAREDARVAEVESVQLQSIGACMCAPFKPGETVLGALYLDKLSVPNRFSQEDLEFLTAFANQTAVAIENALLHQRAQEDAVLKSHLLRFFSPGVAARVQGLGAAPLTLVETPVTALFCDITDFTALAASMRPLEIAEWLNEYFPVMSDIVFRNEGTLEKYIGDAILAVWGAPFGGTDDADRAVATAVEIQRALARLNRQWAGSSRPPLAVHIGLNTGPVAAGNIGSEKYLQYATLGDTTNVAARICSVAAPGEIVLSEATRQALRARDVFQTEALEPVLVKGKKELLTLHRLHWSAQ